MTALLEAALSSFNLMLLLPADTISCLGAPDEFPADPERNGFLA
jgi:hypothetical protein